MRGHTGMCRHRSSALLPRLRQGRSEAQTWVGGRTASTNVTPIMSTGYDARRAEPAEPVTPAGQLEDSVLLKPAALRRPLSEPLVAPRRWAHLRQARARSRPHLHWLIREPTLQSRAIPGQNPAEAGRIRTARQDATVHDRHGDRRLPRRTATQARRLHGERRQPREPQMPLRWWRDVPWRSPRARHVP
jgi:hypothetical protein